MMDTMEPVPWSQGPSSHRMPPSADWQQAGPPVPGAYPPGGQYPRDSPHPPGDHNPQESPYPARGKDKPKGRHRLTDPFQQPEPQQPWPEAPAGAMPVVGEPPLPAGPGQYSPGDAYPGPYGNGQAQFPPGQFGPGFQYGRRGGPGGQWLSGKLAFKASPVAVAVAVAVVIGIFLIVAGAHALS